MRGYRLLAALLLAAPPAPAGEIAQANISYRDGRYEIDADMHLDATAAAVRRIVTDYDHLERLSGTITDAVVLERYDERRLKRRLSINTCVLFFCARFDMVENVEAVNPDDIRTTIIPEESDFEYGESRWQITPIDAHHTSLHFSAIRQPHFWIPPLIGPWLMKRKMLFELKDTVLRIEQLARDEDAVQ